jgi:hypothetical protein
MGMRKIRRTIFKMFCDARRPAVKRRLSPGKKKPKNNPDSANTIVNNPTYPTVSIRSGISK